MDDTGINNLLTPPPEDHEVLAKRQKIKIDSSNLNPSEANSSRASEWERNYLMREITACRTRLSNTEATATQLREMKTEIAEAFAEKEEILEIQRRVDSDTIKHLEVRLEAAEKSCQAQGIVKSEMSSVKSKMREKIHSLFIEKTEINKNSISSTSGETPTCSKLQENKPNIQTQREESLGLEIKHIHANPQCSGPKQPDIQIQESKSVSSETIVWEEDVTLLLSRVNSFENQLQSAKNMISTLRDTVKSQPILDKTVPVGGKALKVEEGVEKPRVKGGDSLERDKSQQRKNTEEFASQAVKSEPSTNATEKKSSSIHQTHTNHEGKPEAGGSEQNRRLNVSDCYVLVSSKKFFEIDWNKYFKRNGCHKFTCKKCPEVRSTKHSIEDHVWVQHCGGTFKCPYCLDRSLLLIYRYSIVKHMRTFHPDECSPKK